MFLHSPTHAEYLGSLFPPVLSESQAAHRAESQAQRAGVFVALNAAEAHDIVE
jgi:hypothetical protein